MQHFWYNSETLICRRPLCLFGSKLSSFDKEFPSSKINSYQRWMASERTGITASRSLIYARISLRWACWQPSWDVNCTLFSLYQRLTPEGTDFIKTPQSIHEFYLLNNYQDLFSLGIDLILVINFLRTSIWNLRWFLYFLASKVYGLYYRVLWIIF